MSILTGQPIEVRLVLRGARAALGPLLILVSPVILAAAQTVQPGAADDFRAAYATPQDIAEGQRLAQSTCAACHGIDGISRTNGTPHLAGQRPVYLYQELRIYQAGGRGKNPMNDVVKFLSDVGLVKVAAYYAGLDPVQPAPPAGTRVPPAAPDPVDAGKASAASCAGCHGEAGISSTAGMPSLVGLDPAYLVAAMKAYRGSKRRHDMMKALISGQSDADMNNIALFYATQKVGRARTTAPGNKSAGKTAAAACAACHGDAGVSPGNAPSLAGQDATYLAAAMRGYKDGSRTDAMMQGLAASTSDAVARDLAAYYASLQPQPPKVNKPLSVAEWVQRCDRCHGINGNSTDPRLPALAAQRREYLERVLESYRSGARRSQAMAAMSGALTAADVSGLAAHYSRQTARGIVYVVLPAGK